MSKNTRKKRGSTRKGEYGAMTVSELSRRTDVPAHVVRYYSRIGLLKPARDRGNGYKLFASDDVPRLLFIRKAQTLGYTLAEIARIFEEAAQGDSPCPVVREIIAKRIKENRHRVDALLRMQSRMEKAVVQWGKLPDGTPNGHSVCHLIESALESGPI